MTPRQRVMVVACNFPPDASVGTMRTLRLVRHLAGSGCDVNVVTLDPDGFRPGTVVDAALLDKVPAATTVLRARSLRPFERLGSLLKRATPVTAPATTPSAATPAAPVPARLGPLRRVKRAVTAALTLPDREVSWVMPAVWRGWLHARAHLPDVVYSSGPPFSAHLVGMFIARLVGRPWVADFRDPWARAPWRDDRFRFELKAWALLEAFVVRRAQSVVFATETNRRDFAAQYGSASSRFHVVPNGCDVTEFGGLVTRPDRHGGKFVLLHAGSLYGARNPAVLLRAIASAIARGRLDPTRFALRFIGRLGIPGVDLPAVARELGLADVVEFANHMPRRDSLQEMLDASALLVVQPVTTVSIPAKLYEYMAAGRPILALAEPGGETSDLITRTGAGTTVLADDDRVIEDALVSLVHRDRDAFVPVDRQAFDGALRAGELHAILASAITQGATPGARSVREGATR